MVEDAIVSHHAHEDVEERASARQHGRAGQRDTIDVVFVVTKHVEHVLGDVTSRTGRHA